jgi:hypothetical protein
MRGLKGLHVTKSYFHKLVFQPNRLQKHMQTDQQLLRHSKISTGLLGTAGFRFETRTFFAVLLACLLSDGHINPYLAKVEKMDELPIMLPDGRLD